MVGSVNVLKIPPFSCKAYFAEDVLDVSLEMLFNVEAAFSFPEGTLVFWIVF